MSVHEMTVYDGQQLIGIIKVAKDGKVTAFDPDGRRLNG